MSRTQINIRMTQEEKDELERQAREHHMTVSMYIKYLLFLKDKTC